LALDFSDILGGRGWGGGRSICVNIVDLDDLLLKIEARLESRDSFSVATLNLDHLVKLRRDPAFRAAYNDQTYVTADGNPIVWLCRLAGQRISLTPGSELIHPVAEIAARLNVPVALVGSTEESLSGAASALLKKHPAISIVTKVAPSMGFDATSSDLDAVIAKIQDSNARICFLALGAPKQEIFASIAQGKLPETGFISVGAGLDFLSGKQKRAPLWMQSMALEWLWRLLNNPRRLFFRYAQCFSIFLFAMYRMMVTGKNKGE
jgi:exopolysaccharide biosynthesis WecB/TagA/CpsF family protein